MKGIRFYLEYNSIKDKRQNNHNGNVLAVFYDLYRFMHGGIVYDCIGALTNNPNSSVCSTSASDDYISDNCKRISEEKARVIHPALFQYLD